MDVVRHAAIGEDLDAAEELDTHQKVDEPVLLLVVEEERLVRNPRNQVVALASLNDPFPPRDAAQATTSAAPKSSIYSQAYTEGSLLDHKPKLNIVRLPFRLTSLHVVLHDRIDFSPTHCPLRGLQKNYSPISILAKLSPVRRD